MVPGTSLVAVEVLQTIEKYPRITPAEIAKKTNNSVQYVRNTLRVLTELQLAETPVRGVYVITDLGKYILKEAQKEAE